MNTSITDKKHHLITIVFSHYNEKARWGLDYFGIPYTESAYLPLVHFPFVWWQTRFQGKSDEISTKAATPVLKTQKGFIQGSSEILKYLSDQYGTKEKNLYPSKEVAELEKEFTFNLGPHTRRVVYYHTLPNKQLSKKLAKLNSPGWQSFLWNNLMPVVRLGLKKGMNINPHSQKKSLRAIQAVFNKVDQLLADKRNYLVGKNLTAADITFACMAAPILLVRKDEGFSARLPYLEESGSELAKIVQNLRNTPAGQFALRIFKEHRRKGDGGKIKNR